MSEKQAEAPRKGGWLASWIKTLVGGFAGVVSGAVVMYASPFLDKAVRPTKPVANFAVEQQGLTVTLQNRSFGSGDGYWDFGDGSPLEPFEPGKDVVTHTYTRQGDYTVKLTVRNILGDENERTVTVRLDGARSDPPRIEGLEVVPVSPGSYAPATYRLTAKVSNAQVCVWDFGDGQKFDVSMNPSGAQERTVTFANPGGYVVKVAAVQGTQVAQKSEVVNVLDPPSGALTAVLKLSEKATRVESLPPTSYTFAEAAPPNATAASFAVNRRMPASAGYEIADVLVAAPGGKPLSLRDKGELALDAPQTRNLRLKIAPDRLSLSLTGELVRDPKKPKEQPRLLLPVTVVQERRTPVTRTLPLAAALTLPGTATVTLPPPPPGWAGAKRELRLEVRDGDRVVWKEGDLPRGAAVAVNGRRYLLTAQPQAGDKVRIDIADAPRGQTPPIN